MTTTPDLNWIANHMWGIADDVLRDVYVGGNYRDVILPMTVIRRLDAVLEPTKQAVLDRKASLDASGVVDERAGLREAAGRALCSTSITLKDLLTRASRRQLRADFEDYLGGFSPSGQDILDNFELRKQIPRLSKADAFGSLIEKLTSPEVNLSPSPVKDTDVPVRRRGLDNGGHGDRVGAADPAFQRGEQRGGLRGRAAAIREGAGQPGVHPLVRPGDQR